MLARYAPGLGDPMDMALPDLREWQAAVVELLEREYGKPTGGPIDHRARVESEMRRLHG